MSIYVIDFSRPFTVYTSPMKEKLDRLLDAANTPSYETSRKFTTSNESSGEWSPERIKLEIELRGFSLASLSREHGLHESACRIALRKPWPRVERIIAKCLDVEGPAIIFPDRYDENGYPLKFSKHLGNTNAKRSRSKK